MPAADNATVPPAVPERDLAAAVLFQAAQDAVEPRKVQGSNAAAQDEARLFCFAHVGAWRIACDAWCDLAGVDPDAFRDGVRRLQLAHRIRIADGEGRRAHP